jgi:hypothetical protein
MSIRIATKIVDITPTTQCSLGGNGTAGNFSSVESNLEATIFLVHENSSLKLFLSFDLLYVGEFLSKNIRRAASDYVTEENIWISASHTHNAPMTDGLKPKLGVVDSLYLDHVSREVSKAVRELFEKFDEALTVRIVERIGKVSVGTYRRRRRPPRIQMGRVRKGDIYMGPNPWKKIDRRIKRLDFVSEKGDLVGVMWNFACHPVSHPGINQVSAHFPGEVRSSLRRFNPNLPVLFLQGFAGDIRPKSIGGFREHPFRTLKNGPEFRLFSKAEYFKFCRKISRAVSSTKVLETVSAMPSKKSLRVLHASGLYIRNSKTRSVSIQIMPLGGIYLLGISAEPSSNLLAGLAPQIPADRIWFCGYLEDVFGYFPTKSQLSEGGYESSGFQKSFDCGELEESGLDVVSKVILDYFSEIN